MALGCALLQDSRACSRCHRKRKDRAQRRAIETIEQLREKIGIPTRLRDIGVTRDMLPGFAEKAFAIKRLMRVNPRMPQSASEILAIYEAAY